MDGLEMPFVFSGLSVNSNHRIAEQIVAGPVATPVIRRRRSDGHIEDAALLVHRQVPSPDVRAGALLPAVIQPCVMTDFARLRHRVKVPELFAGAGVEGA